MVYIGLLKSKKNWRYPFCSQDFLGFLRFLRSHKIPYKVFSNFKVLITPSKPTLLILPSVKNIENKDLEIIKEYVNKGGSIIATYNTSLNNKEFGLKEIIGCSFLKKIKDTVDCKLSIIPALLKKVLYDKNNKLILQLPALIVKKTKGKVEAELINKDDKIISPGIISNKINNTMVFYFSFPLGMALNNFTFTFPFEFRFIYNFTQLNHFLVITLNRLKRKFPFLTKGKTFIKIFKKLFMKKVGYEYSNVETNYIKMKMKVSDFLIEVLLEDIIKRCFGNIPLVYIWYWQKKRMAFVQRVDVDDPSILEHYKELLEICKKYKIKLSLFFNSSLLYDKYVKIKEIIKSFLKTGHICGTHGSTQKFSHQLWTTSLNKASKKNIERMLQESLNLLNPILKPFNQKCIHFSSPCEDVNEKTFSVAEKIGLETISSGNSGSDGLPYFCIGKKKEYNLLQIPPAIANLYEESNLPIDFYKKLIDNKWLLGNFLCLYFHPDYFETHKNLVVSFWKYLEKFQENVWITDFSELSSYWKKRDKVEIKYKYNNNSLLITLKNNNSSSTFISLAISLPKDKDKITLEKEEINKEIIEFKELNLKLIPLELKKEQVRNIEVFY